MGVTRSAARRRPEPQTRAERNVAWIETFCRVPEGQHVGRPIVLRDWQRAELRKIYDNPAGTRRAILSFGRKNGKTSLAAMLMLLHLCGPEAVPNGQLYSAAQSRDQAAILFALAAKMVRQSPDLDAVVQIRETAKTMLCPELGTVYRALSADATTAYGLSPSFIIHDEAGQIRGPRSELFDALETAVGAQGAPLSVIISTQAATDDDLLSVLIDDALQGADPRTVVSLYTAPADMDPFSEEAIRRANPAAGDFLNLAEAMDMAETARRMPSREAQFRNLVLNQRVEVNDPYISPAVWQSCAEAPAADWSGVQQWAGLDLSAANDLTAFVRVAWIDGQMHVRPTFWLPEAGLREKAHKDRVPYDVWAREGWLETTPGATVDYDYVAPALVAALRDGVDRIAFDRWNMRFLRPALERAGATADEMERFAEFGQGYQSMSPALRMLDGLLLNGRLRHGGHPVLTMCAQNAVVKSDPAGNRKLVKLTGARRIDGMVALAMAVATAGDPVEATPVALPRVRIL